MKKTIALIAGGYTGEYVISLKSAAMIEKNLDSEKFRIFKIIITKDKWFYMEEGGREVPVDRNDFSLLVKGEKINFDCAFIIIHGSPGEDGKLQGYFDMLQIPYTTCDALTSAITMNKGYTKSIVADVKNVQVAKSVQLFNKQEFRTDEISASLQFPVFVKPNNGGSSIGMSKVTDPSELQSAIDKAFKEDNQVIVEEYIKGREFTVGAVRMKGRIDILPVTEIISSKEFFDYEAKYTSGVSQEITPAQLSESERLLLEEIARAAYLKLNCRGVVRMDFIMQEHTGNFYLLEINTVPGQTENSVIPQQVRAAGKSMEEFYGEIVEEALK